MEQHTTKTKSQINARLKELAKLRRTLKHDTIEYSEASKEMRLLRQSLKEMEDQERKDLIKKCNVNELAASKSLREHAQGLGLKSNDAITLREEASFLMMSLVAFELMREPEDIALLNSIVAMRLRAQIDMGIKPWPVRYEHLQPVVPSQPESAGNHALATS